MDIVSVIIPIYKVEKYLNKCVESIVNQTYTNLEIILVNDGSPDNCPKMCDEWAKKDSRIKVVHKSNGGLSDARNAGMQVMTGKYLTFIDSDDYVDSTYIQNLVDGLVSENADLYAVNFGVFYEDSDKIDYVNRNNLVYEIDSYNKVYKLILEYISYDNFPHTAWGKLYKTEIINKNHLTFYDNKKIFAEDLYFNSIYAPYCKKVVFSNKPLYFYLQRKGALSALSPVERLKKCQNLIENIQKTLSNSGLNEVEINFYYVYFWILNKVLQLDKRNHHKNWRKILKELNNNDYYFTAFNYINQNKGYYKQYYSAYMSDKKFGLTIKAYLNYKKVLFSTIIYPISLRLMRLLSQIKYKLGKIKR